MSIKIIIKKTLCLALLLSLVLGLIPVSTLHAKSKLKLNKSSITMVGGIGFVKLQVKGLKKGQKVSFTSKNSKVAYLTRKNSEKGYVYVRADNPGKTKVVAKIGSKKLTCKIKVTDPFKGVKFVIPNLIKNYEYGDDYGVRYAISNTSFYNDGIWYNLRFNVTLIKERTTGNSNQFFSYVAFLDKDNNVLNNKSSNSYFSGLASIDDFSLGETKKAEVIISDKAIGKIKTVVFMENPVDPSAYTGMKLPDTAFSGSSTADDTPTPTPTGKQLTQLYYENSSYTWNHDLITRSVWQPTECDGNGIHPFAIMYSSADGSRFTYGDYTYKSSNTSVATIDGNGAVTFVGYGTTILTCSYGTLSSSMTLTITGGGVGTPTPTPYVTPTPTPDAHTHCNHCNGAGSFLCERCGGTGLENCKQCNNTGKITLNSGTVVMCPNCKGVKKNCWDCNGAKRINCKYCRGTGIYNSVCYNCFGTGIATCSRCGGGGVVPCFSCYGAGINRVTGDRCRVCAGSGRLPCDVCDGKCKVWCPECNGTGKQ